MRQIYLDSQAATPVLPEAAEAMRPFFSEEFGSPSSLHRHGLRAREALAHAREQVAGFIHAESSEDIIFTSDGTESANLAVKGVAWANQRRGNHIIFGAAEHPAILHSVEFLTGQGFTCTKVGTNGEGMVDPREVRAALTEKTILIAVQHVNQDVGAIQAVREISQIAGERGIPFYVDAEASAGWLPIDVREMGATLLSFSPQRFYGPKGVGVLYRNRQARLVPLLHGGDQENGRRAGVENIPAIVGAGVAAEIAGREPGQRSERVSRLQRQLWNGLKISVPHIRLNGPEPGPLRSPANLNVSFEFIEGEGLALLCDMNGIAIGAGTACVSKSLGISPALRAMGLTAEQAQGSVIFSLGKDNTAEDIDSVIATLPKLVSQLRSLSPAWDEYQKNA
jgi:cysteine desulfurase